TRITAADARAVGSTPSQLAADYLQTLKRSIRQYRQTLPADSSTQLGLIARGQGLLQRASPWLQGDRINWIQAILGTVLLTLGLVLLLLVVNRLLPLMVGSLVWLVHQRIAPGSSFQTFDLMSRSRFSTALTDLWKTTRLALSLGLILLYIVCVLGLYPRTNHIAAGFFSHSIDALSTIQAAAVDYAPNLFVIALIVFFTYYVLRFIKPIFEGLESGEIAVAGFYADWAVPTYRIIEVCAAALAAVVAFPYLPGFGSPAFQGVSLFVGVLFSLGSSAALSNAIAGVILIYTRAFQVGDRVQVNDTLGDIEEKSLLATRLRTTNNVIVTIPNSSLLSNEVFNFTASRRDTNQPLKISASVGFDYDLPWQTVYDLLRDCALQTTGVLADPPPLVRHGQIDNFELIYQVKLSIDDPTLEDEIYSELYRRICDRCHEMGIEMLTPSYSAIRDGNRAVLPTNCLPDNYTPEGFRLNSLGQLFQVDLKMGAAKANGKAPRPSSKQTSEPGH
ncbi:MAG: mechanosensitive ion channel family protein, partial [Nodosilinea sp.]